MSEQKQLGAAEALTEAIDALVFAAIGVNVHNDHPQLLQVAKSNLKKTIEIHFTPTTAP